MIREIPSQELRWSCPQEWLPAESTAKIEPSQGIIGQDRAVKALEFGLSVDSLGFNVFATGLVGTGKMTAIELHLRPLADQGTPPGDLLYVHNFGRPEQPRLLRLMAGRGAILRERLDRLIDDLKRHLPGMFESEEFQKRLEMAVEDLKNRQQELLRGFEKRVREAGFTLVQVQVGSMTRPEILPLVDERPVTLEKVQSLTEENKFDRARFEALETQHGKLSEELQHVFREMMAVREEMLGRAGQLRRAAVAPLLEAGCTEIAKAVGDPRVVPFLQDLANDVAEHLDLFAEAAGDDKDVLIRYHVNLLVDNGSTKGRPVVIETEPSYGNLFGTVEARVGQNWQSTSDHTRIRAGSLLRANGGYLVMNAFDVLTEAGVYPALKRALRYRRAVVRPREMLFALTGQAIQPEPVDLDVKVVMVGDRRLYDMLHEADEDFRKIFKVLADFDSEMPNGEKQVGDFLSLMAKIVRDEKLLHVQKGGMAALVEEGVRLARNRKRISARFSDVADVLREASFIATANRKRIIGAEEIRLAVLARRGRHSLPEEKLTSYMLDRVLVIETSGTVVGQINGLAVYDLGYHTFGLPGRVTARVALGRDGVVNVEREARLSGPTHDKGVLILSGFLRGTFAHELPLSMTASVAFEQSYAGVDGDSASSTEVYAILSALSGVPIRQDVAVTGSIDQNGHVQAIGGVNEKVEGFFELCRQRGLTGSQGVMIPAANVADLQLDLDVVAAVAAGRFHVWSAERVEEGIELLTGVAAGVRGADGSYPGDSLFGRCAARLEEMAEQLKQYRLS
ncbi:MAG: AAA family ATPase [Acidobacteria bacterium]|nr:AAA family ATPase [Acidobacteriota bacterium]